MSAQIEQAHQEALFKWSRNPATIAKYPAIDLLEGSINGVKLSLAQAKKAKAAGMLKGVHDITLKVARQGFNGLSIELKRPKTQFHNAGVLSDEQVLYGDRLQAEGWSVHYCYGWIEAKAVIEWYLGVENGD